MDPNETLRRLLVLTKETIELSACPAMCAANQPEPTEGHVEMAELVHALDTWLVSGGFLPEAWKQ